MANEKDTPKPAEKKVVKSPVVFYFNPDKGMRFLPVIGKLLPGWNEVPRAVHEATIRPDGKSVIPAEQAVPVRDNVKVVTEGISEAKAVGVALGINNESLIDKTLLDETRPQVRSALEHQKKVVKLEAQPSAELEAMAQAETRPDVAASISKALEAKKG